MTVMTGPPGTLLVLDYPGRRAEARIRDLRLDQAGWQLVHLIEPPVRHRYTAAAYAGQLAARIPAAAGGIHAVLGYCTGAAIAQHVAALVGNRVPLVLFDGTPVTTEFVVREFKTSVAQVGGQVAAEAADAAPDGDMLTRRPAEAFTWMRDTLTRLAAGTLREDGVEEEELTTTTWRICSVYLDWITFLMASRSTDWPEWGGDVVHVASRRHAFTGQWRGARRTFVHLVDSGSRELLTNAQARQHALSCLGAPHVPRGVR